MLTFRSVLFPPASTTFSSRCQNPQWCLWLWVCATGWCYCQTWGLTAIRVCSTSTQHLAGSIAEKTRKVTRVLSISPNRSVQGAGALWVLGKLRRLLGPMVLFSGGDPEGFRGSPWPSGSVLDLSWCRWAGMSCCRRWEGRSAHSHPAKRFQQPCLEMARNNFCSS